jgi:hypothetical protein
MSLITALHDERKRILADLARVDKALQMFGGSAGNAPSLRKTAATRSPEASRVSKAAQGLRWAKELKKGATAIAAAKKELQEAQAALAKSKKGK